jgi:hypothetical protein
VPVVGPQEFLIDIPERDAWDARNALIRSATSASSVSH